MRNIRTVDGEPHVSLVPRRRPGVASVRATRDRAPVIFLCSPGWRVRIGPVLCGLCCRASEPADEAVVAEPIPRR